MIKRTLFAATAMTTVICSAASAENIGMSMALFDDNWLTVLRNGTTAYVAGLDGVVTDGPEEARAAVDALDAA